MISKRYIGATIQDTLHQLFLEKWLQDVNRDTALRGNGRNKLKVIYKGFLKSFIVLYADRICPEHHFVENRIANFPSV